MVTLGVRWGTKNLNYKLDTWAMQSKMEVVKYLCGVVWLPLARLHMQDRGKMTFVSAKFYYSSRWVMKIIKWYHFNPSCVKFQYDKILNILQNYLMQIFDVLVWPRQSLDLNPTEHMWAFVIWKILSNQHQPKECFNCGSKCKLLSIPSLLRNVKRFYHSHMGVSVLQS